MVKAITTAAPATDPTLFKGPLIKAPMNLPRPSIPDQADFYARTVSFKAWPKGAGVKVSDLVNSGFSYLGVSDRVQCFQCGEIFENWRQGETVDIEHARLSPNCVFIQTKLGKKIEPPPPLFSSMEYNVTTSGRKSALVMEQPRAVVTHMDYRHVVDVPASAQNQAKNLHPVAPRDIRARLDIASSRKLLDMGFKKPLLAQVIGERLAETGDDFPSFLDYFIAVKNAEQILSGGQVDTLKGYYEKSIERLANLCPVTHAKNSSSCDFNLRKLGGVMEPLPSTSAIPVMDPLKPITPHADYGNGMNKTSSALHPAAMGDIRAILDMAPSRKLLDIGFKKPLLAHVIGERLAETGDNFPSFMDYFIAVKFAEQILSGGQVDTLKEYYEKSIERLANPASLIPEDEAPEAPAAPNDETVHDLDSSPDCEDANANGLFLPDRDLGYFCSTCADELPRLPYLGAAD